MNSIRLRFALIFVFSVLLTACGSGTADDVGDGTQDSETDTASAAEPSTSDVPTTTATDRAIEIAEAFMAARDQRDADGVLALLTPEVEVHDFGRWVRTYEEYPALIEWMDIFDWRWELQECSEADSGPPVRIICRYLMENDWSRAQEADPVPGQIDLVVDGDLIVEVDSDTGQWVPIVFVPWFEWLEAEHPDDIPVLYRFDEQGQLTGGPATDPEALDLFRQYIVEYIASFEASDAD